MNNKAYIQGYLFKEAADKDGTLQLLIQAKEHSDKSDYAKKREIMRKLLKRESQNFTVDSRNQTVLGLTHTPSGFRIHMPERDVYDLMEKKAEDIYRPFTDAEFEAGNHTSLINETEGFRCAPYKCSEGRQTIGYGTNLDANRGMAEKLLGRDKLKSILSGQSLMTKPEAEKLRDHTIAGIQRYLDTDPNWSKLKGKYNPAGVIPYIYQTGRAKAIPGPGFRRNLEAGNNVGAYLELLNYKDPDMEKSPGLPKAYWKKMRASFPLELLKTDPAAAYIYRTTRDMTPPTNKEDRLALIGYLRQQALAYRANYNARKRYPGINLNWNPNLTLEEYKNK